MLFRAIFEIREIALPSAWCWYFFRRSLYPHLFQRGIMLQVVIWTTFDRDVGLGFCISEYAAVVHAPQRRCGDAPQMGDYDPKRKPGMLPSSTGRAELCMKSKWSWATRAALVVGRLPCSKSSVGLGGDHGPGWTLADGRGSIARDHSDVRNHGGRIRATSPRRLLADGSGNLYVLGRDYDVAVSLRCWPADRHNNSRAQHQHKCGRILMAAPP